MTRLDEMVLRQDDLMRSGATPCCQRNQKSTNSGVSAVNGLSAFEHSNEVLDLPRLGRSFLHRANPIQDRISISARERREESRGLRVRIERILQIRWNLGLAGWCVRRHPSAISLRFFNFQLSRSLHAPRRNQFQRAFSIDLRPLAARPAWGKTDQPAVSVVLVDLAVDPAVAKGAVDRLSFGDAGDARTFLTKSNPGAVGIARLRRKPAIQCDLISK